MVNYQRNNDARGNAILLFTPYDEKILIKDMRARRLVTTFKSQRTFFHAME
jgi:hypothetical protein